MPAAVNCRCEANVCGDAGHSSFPTAASLDSSLLLPSLATHPQGHLFFQSHLLLAFKFPDAI